MKTFNAERARGQVQYTNRGWPVDRWYFATRASLFSRFLVAFLLAGCSGSFGAETQLIFRSDRVNEAFQGGAANYARYTGSSPENLAYRKFVIELYRRNPDADPQKVIDYI